MSKRCNAGRKPWVERSEARSPQTPAPPQACPDICLTSHSHSLHLLTHNQVVRGEEWEWFPKEQDSFAIGKYPDYLSQHVGAHFSMEQASAFLKNVPAFLTRKCKKRQWGCFPIKQAQCSIEKCPTSPTHMHRSNRTVFAITKCLLPSPKGSTAVKALGGAAQPCPH